MRGPISFQDFRKSQGYPCDVVKTGFSRPKTLAYSMFSCLEIKIMYFPESVIFLGNWKMRGHGNWVARHKRPRADGNSGKSDRRVYSFAK